jgi:hypothetical protein
VFWSEQRLWNIWTICRNNERKLEREYEQNGFGPKFPLVTPKATEAAETRAESILTCLDNSLQLWEHKSHQEHRTWQSLVSSQDISSEVTARFTSRLQQTSHKESKVWSAHRTERMRSLVGSNPVTNSIALELTFRLGERLVCVTFLMGFLSLSDRLCGLVVRVLGYRSGGPGSIPGTIKKK